MTETQVGFLYKAASTLQQTGDSKITTLLRSYYLMRCKNITKGYGLPEKHFSANARCSHCCIEWNKETETRVKALKHNRKQRQRIRSQKANKNNKEIVEKRKQLLNSNEIEQVCSFCKQSTIILAKKPEKIKTLAERNNKQANSNKTKQIQNNKAVAISATKVTSANAKKIEKKKSKIVKINEVNVYSVTKDIFSLNNKKNTLDSTKKEEPKIIKNNKKKKDKFAGLCQRAVLATAKIKQEKDKHNKLNLFLKPSS